jgi:diguanylate cyclase (GGDEF)-like protein/PAS domain S-box-containing protein
MCQASTPAGGEVMIGLSLEIAAALLPFVGYIVVRRFAALREQNARLTRLLEQTYPQTEREAADKQLALLNYALDHVKEAALLVGEDARFYYANEEACRELGYSRDELLGLSIPEIAPDFPRERWPEHWRELKTHGSLIFEGRHKTKDGRIFPVEINANYFEFDGNGYNLGLIRNISERRRMEAELCRQADFQHVLLNALSDVGAQLMMIENGRIIHVGNRELARRFGYSDAELEAHPALVDIVHPDDRARVMNYYQRRMAGEEALNSYELGLITRSGERREYEVAVAIVPGTDPVRIITVGQDITERKRMEASLEAREREFRTLIENAPDNIVRYDRDLRIRYANPAMAKTLGQTAAQLIGGRTDERFPGSPAMLEYQAVLTQVLESGQTAEYLLVNEAGCVGRALYDNIRIAPEFAADGTVAGVIAFGRDLRQQHALERELAQREQELRTLVDNFPDTITRYDREYRRVFVNPAYAKATGQTLEAALSTALADSWVAQNITSAHYQALLQQVMDSGEAADVMLEWTVPDGASVSYDLRIVPEYEADGQASGTLVIGRNVSRLRQTEKELIQREQEFRALAEHSPDTITRYDRDCRRLYANSRMQAYSGVALDELLCKTPVEFPGGAQATAYQDKIRQVFNDGAPGEFELSWRGGDGNDICTHIRLTPEFDGEGRVVSVLAVGRDISEIDAYRKQIHNLAFFDTLTFLPNRALLSDRIRQVAADAAWHGNQFGLMMLDLDRFKEVNDTLGHGVGDLLLRQAAERLQACVRNYDTVARLGGDEFAILLPEIRNGGDLGSIAGKIVNEMNQSFLLEGRELYVSTSIGIAVFPDDSVDTDTLFRYADSAMYHAKKQQGNNFQFYSSELSAHLADKVSCESALRKALVNAELELYYQPQVSLHSGEIIGAEALLRWNRGKQGMAPPDQFIPIAEETGLIVEIGEWVLLSACQAAVAWNRYREKPLRIAVNLSTRQFIRNDLVGTVRRVLEETGCRVDWLKLEITESLLLEDSGNIAAMLSALAAMGLVISIDDFGTGYSALSYLNRFPVQQIKIDKSFVQGIPEDHDKAELVKAMIYIAKSLRLDLVAEGVETSEQANYLLERGCVTVQGYLFGKPMPQTEFERMLSGNQRIWLFERQSLVSGLSELEHQLLTRLTANLPGFVFTFRRSPDGHFSFPFASEGIRELYGLTPDEVAEDMAPLHALAHPDDAPFIEASIASAALEMGPFRMNFRILHPTQGERWIECRSTPEREVGGGILWHGVMLDVTEQKRTENALQFVAQRGWIDSGESFFDALAQYLGETLGVDHVIIDRLSDDPCIAETLASYARDAGAESPCYGLEGTTACENVIMRSFCRYRHDTEQRLPNGALLADMGTERHAGIPLWDSTGKVLGLITVMDSRPLSDAASITRLLQLVAPRAAAEIERELSDRMLQNSEREFRTLAENTPDPLVRYAPDGRRLYVNPALVRISGKSAESLLAHTPLDAQLVSPDDADKMMNCFRRVLEMGAVVDDEVALVKPDGRKLVFHNQYAPEFGQNGEVASILCISRDITERKRMEDVLREQADFQQTLLNALYDVGIQLMMVENGRIIHIGNRKRALEFGFTDAELDAHPLLMDMVHPDDRERVMGYHMRRLAGEAVPSSYELGLMRPDNGERREYETAVAIVPGTNPVRVVSVGKDITERKKIENALHKDGCAE